MFQRVADDRTIAQQITTLLNKHNHLSIHYNTTDVLSNKNTYIVETLGSLVVACIQIEKQAYIISEIRHLTVHPKMRRQGLAKTLIFACLNKSPTPVVYATIREDNTNSIKAFESCGFMKVSAYITGTRTILLYVATCTKWKKQVGISNTPAYTNYHRR